MQFKKALSLALSTALALSLAAPALAGEPAETARPWYAEAQDYVTQRGLMTGTDKGFEPQGTVTVDGDVLTADTDYTLTVENNDKPGDAYC